MKAHHLQSLSVAALLGGAALVGSATAQASNPLEYPDNGAAQFSRGGAWLAVANEPIATHYNPAGLATQGSGFSIEQQLNLQKICYDRRDASGNEEVAQQTPGLQYAPVCNQRSSFPSTIPSISIAWRASKKLGFGISIVPPAAYGTPRGAFPVLTEGVNQNIQACLASGKTPATCGGTGVQQVPAPYRYQQLDQLTTILFPTIGVGYEVLPKLRVGAAFISGIAVINTSVAGIQSEGPQNTTDHANEDTLSTLRTKDLFVPGAILSVHWSPLPQLDVAAWGRWISDVSTTQGELNVQTFPFTTPALGSLQPVCRQDPSNCNNSTATPNQFGKEGLKKFDFPYPPEVRLGLRFHQPRSLKDERKTDAGAADSVPKRDPLHDDVFDLEVDGSYSMNASANTVQVRFAELNGGALITLKPIGFLPPNADKWNGYQNSFGVRFGGQANVVPDKLGIRAGTWIETQAQDPKWLSVATVPSLRGGFGGGLVFRQDFIDISIGYQMQWAQGLNNDGVGAMRAVTGQASTGNNFPAFNLNNEPPGVSAANRTQFRSVHFVNDGRVTQSAHAFTLGGTVRF